MACILEAPSVMISPDPVLYPGNLHSITASAIGHAGEFLQGVIEEEQQLHAVLVSIPVSELGSQACFRPGPGVDLTVHPHWKQKSRRAFALAWECFSRVPPGGSLRIQSDLPVARGMGSSTADCVAAIRAAACVHGGRLSEEQIAGLAHQAEKNSDATMYGRDLVLFCHREGRAHRKLFCRCPSFDLALVEATRGSRSIETDSLQRPAYTSAEIAEFSHLVARFSQAIRLRELETMGAVAERSADINQRYHAMPGLLQVRAIARDLGAYGTAIAHSGDLQIMLFPRGALEEDRKALLQRELSRNGLKLWRTLTETRDAERAAASEVEEVAH